MSKIFITFVSRFEKLPPLLQWIYLSLILFILGLIDYLTGPEIAFALFYTIPVSLATWTRGKNAGVIFSFLSGLVWLFADLHSGETYSSPQVAFWNTTTRILFFYLVTLLLTELRQALESQRVLAHTDFITGLLNGRAFYDEVLREFARTHRDARPLMLVYLDIDNFKSINDSYGHPAGDKVLQRVAQTLKNTIRASDFAARIGGDEFALLFPEISSETAQSLLSRLQENLRATMASHPLPVTFSLGAVTYLQPPTIADAMLKTADELLYKVKTQGKDGLAYALYQGDQPLVSHEKIEGQPLSSATPP